MPECAHAMDYDLYAEGISCIEHAQIEVEKFIKLADQLGIEWFVLADNDQEGEKYKKSAIDQLGTRKKDGHIRLLDHGNMEIFLCMEGFGDIYEANISDQKRTSITAIVEKGTLEYWQQVVKAQKRNTKPGNALTVAERMIEND